MNTDELLAERGKTHGEYWDHAEFTQDMKDHLRSFPNWKLLAKVQRESLDMFAHKMGRIMTGNPNLPDHWDDIAGYSRLVSQRMDRILGLGVQVSEALSKVEAAVVAPPVEEPQPVEDSPPPPVVYQAYSATWEPPPPPPPGPSWVKS